MKTFILLALASLAAAGPLVSRDTIAAPVVKNVSDAYNITTTFKYKLRRDGGGGGVVDGKNIMTFADTRTLNEPFNKAHKFYPFVSNSIANATENGTTVHDYGKDWVQQAWAFGTPKKPIGKCTTEVAKPNHRYAIWPNANIVTGCNGTCGYTVSDVVDITFRKLPYSETFLYSTLSKITLDHTGKPIVTRKIVSLWYAYHVRYGSFGSARAEDGSDDIYMFASGKDSKGVKVAKVCEAEILDKSKYKFWNGQEWTSHRPAPLDKASNIFTYNRGGFGPGTGEVFYNKHLGTWIAVFVDELTADSTYRLMYSLSGEVTGPWSTDHIDIYKAPCCADSDPYYGKPGYPKCGATYNYGTHAYPHIDPTGKTLLLGWTYNGQITKFAKLEFE